MSKRIVVTGMALNTPLSDTLDGTLEALLAGRSAVTRWRSLDVSRCYGKIGADLGGYDVEPALRALTRALPAPIGERLARVVRRVPWSPRLGLLLAGEVVRHAGLSVREAAECHVVVGGHNLSAGYVDAGFVRYAADPAKLPVGHELYSLDTTQAACVSELLDSRGPAFTVGGACATGNLALLAGYRAIALHGAPRALVLGAVPDPSVVSLHGFALLGALSIASFNDTPEQASRPWDQRREGFVPAHGGGALILEDAEVAAARGAPVYAELAGVAVCSDANHLTVPDEGGQARAMMMALRRAGVAPEEVGYVSAHATSTPVGDLVELRAIRRALGAVAERVRVNATKSMLGHTFSAAAIIEGIVGILQMNAGKLHGTRNVDALDPSVDLDVCADGPVVADIGCFVNNAFGFGGYNAVSVLRRVLA